MPVISLPEYLGLQEAPQRPVFNRTRQIEPDNPWARTMEVADSLTALRQQRPMAQIQAIQNEYDAIRDNAEKLRREREVAMQAEQAVSALSRMTPDDPDYENQRMQFQRQLPMAQFDPRVNSILSDNDRIYAARQQAEAKRRQAEAKRQQEIIDREAELYGVTGMSGMSDARIREAAKDPRTAAALKTELSKKPTEMSPLAQRGLEEMMKLEAAGDAAGVARVNNFMVSQGIHPNPSAKMMPMPEDDGMYFGTPSAPSTGTRRGGVNPVFEEYRKLYQNALEREAKAREGFNEEELYPLTDASGNPIPPKAPPQPYELESSKIVQQALQMGYDPRYNIMVPVPSEPLRGVNPQAFSQAAQSIVDSGSRIVAPVDYSQAELTPYAGMETSTPLLNRFERMQIPSGVGVQPSQQQAVVPPPVATLPPKADVEAAIRARLANVPVDELPQAIENERVKLGEAEQINKAWQGAKGDLESKLKKLLPDKDVGYGINPLEQFARQVLNPDSAKSDTQAPQLLMGAGSGNIRPSTVPNYQKTMAKIGLNPYQKAFTEPGVNRKWLFELFGTQDVTNDEAIKAWAKDFAEKRGILDVPAAKDLSPDLRQKALSRVLEQVELD